MKKTKSKLRLRTEEKYKLSPGEQRVIVRATPRFIASGKLTRHVRYILQKNRGDELSPPVPFDEKGNVVHDPIRLAEAWERIANPKARAWLLTVSPERGNELDMKQFLMGTMKRLKHEMGRSFIRFIAAEHRNTNHRHLHIVIPEIAKKPSDRVLYPYRDMHFALKWCASREATLTLGHEYPFIQQDIRRSMSVPHWTRVDDLIRDRLGPDRTFRPETVETHYDPKERFKLRLMMARLKWFKKNNLAKQVGKNFRLEPNWMERILVPEKRVERFNNLSFATEDGSIRTGADLKAGRTIDLTRTAFSGEDVSDNRAYASTMKQIQFPVNGPVRIHGVMIHDPANAKKPWTRQVVLLEAEGKLVAVDIGEFTPGVVRLLVRNVGRTVVFRDIDGTKVLEPVLEPETAKQIGDIQKIRNLDPQVRLLFLWDREEEIERRRKLEITVERRQKGMGFEHRIGEAAHVLGIVLPPVQPLHLALGLALEI